MKLTYAQLGQTFETADSDQLATQPGYEGVVDGAVKALAIGLGLHEKSIHYLLQNGWSQSLQDSFAGPRAKAKADKEDDAVVEEIILSSIAKRVESIKAGLLSASGSNGRDPIKTVAKDLLQKKAESLGKRLPKDKDKLAKLVDVYIAANRQSIDAEIRKRRISGQDEVSLDDILAE